MNRPWSSLRGAQRRGNPAGLGGRTGLLRFARNDGLGLVAFFAALVVATPSLADSLMPAAEYAHKQLPDARQEAQARALMDTIRCLVCQGQAIGDSDAEMAGDMRALIRTRIQAGESPQEVRAWLVSRYGNWVTYDPPLDGTTWPLWAAPLLLVLFGLWLVRGRFKRRRKG